MVDVDQHIAQGLLETWQYDREVVKYNGNPASVDGKEVVEIAE